jgi:hypothetical protein
MRHQRQDLGRDAGRLSGFDLLVQRAVFETAHHDLYRNAVLWNGKLARERSNHRTGHIEGLRDLFAPARLMLIEVVQHPDPNREGAVLFDNVRVEAREIETLRTLGKHHGSAPVKGVHAHESEGSALDFLPKLRGCLHWQIAASSRVPPLKEKARQRAGPFSEHELLLLLARLVGGLRRVALGLLLWGRRSGRLRGVVGSGNRDGHLENPFMKTNQVKLLYCL